MNGIYFNEASENEELERDGNNARSGPHQGRSCLVSHTGDSRVYAINENGVRQVTRDHSYVNVLLDSGEITEEEAAAHPQRNWIMKAIGSEKTIDPDLYSIELEDQSYLLHLYGWPQ